MFRSRLDKQVTLGFLGTGLFTDMQVQLWQGATHTAQERGARLLFFPANALRSADQFIAQANILYDLIDRNMIHGLLIWTGGLLGHVEQAEGHRFFERYNDFPVVTIGGPLRNRPDLSVDNYGGMYSAIEHLIEAHGRRHFAIIRGPLGHPEADQRHRACLEALRKHGLRDDVVAQGAFEVGVSEALAAEAATRWLDNPRHEIDAIVAATDYMALAAIRVLNARGLRVPDDIAVAGFDDIVASRASIPSLTTVQQPFYDRGRRGVEMLLALLEGETLPPQSLLPSKLITRESCGCISRTLKLADVPIHDDPVISVQEPNTGTAVLQHEMQAAAGELGLLPGQLDDLAKLLLDDLRAPQSDEFLPALRTSLIATVAASFDAMAWQNAISVLRRYVLSAAAGVIGVRGETLVNQARVMVMEIAHRAYMKQQFEAERRIEELSATMEALITSFDSAILLKTLREQLPTLGFTSFYLSLYEEPEQPEAWSRLVLACADGKPVDLPDEELRFASSRLIPETLMTARKTASFVVEPLYFREQQLGLLVLEVGPPQGIIYENLRTQVSSALEGSRLLRQAQHHATQLELAVSQTLTTAEEILVTSTQTAEYSQAVAESAHRSVDVSQMGQAAVARTIAGMQAIQQQVADIAGSMAELAQQTRKIGEIIDSVKEIADQSQLLALNARIEAARAGAEGRGFSVVANEMRQLAEQSRQSTLRVRDILNEIARASQAAQQMTEAGSQSVLQGMELASQAGSAIHDLADTIQQAAQAASEIAASAQQQRIGMEMLVENMQAIQQGKTSTPDRLHLSSPTRTP
jgi:DNA-binding LacI/PurR family transcriptional regulator